MSTYMKEQGKGGENTELQEKCQKTPDIEACDDNSGTIVLVFDSGALSHHSTTQQTLSMR